MTPLAPAGTAFRHRVWDALPAIPLGESRTYMLDRWWLATFPGLAIFLWESFRGVRRAPLHQPDV